MTKKVKDLKISEIGQICHYNFSNCKECDLRIYDYDHQEEHECIALIVDDLIVSNLCSFKIADFLLEEELEREVCIPKKCVYHENVIQNSKGEKT